MLFLGVANTIVELGIVRSRSGMVLSCSYFKLFSEIMGIIIWLIQKEQDETFKAPRPKISLLQRANWSREIQAYLRGFCMESSEHTCAHISTTNLFALTDRLLASVHFLCCSFGIYQI